MVRLNCQRCGVEFEAGRRDAKFCPTCKVVRRDERHRGYEHERYVRNKPSGEVTCQNCGATFMARRSDAKWCLSCRLIKAQEKLRNYESRNRHVCSECGKTTSRHGAICRSCANRQRKGLYVGENNPFWKGGKTHRGGYVYVLSPDGPQKHRYRAEHIVVWEQTHGQPLPKGWVVHHFNGVKDDNRPENLLGEPRKQHSPRQQIEPYQERIRELEQRIRDLEGQ